MANRRHSIRDSDGCEGGASKEGVIDNRSHSLCKSHLCEFTLIPEFLFARVYC
jgi:hypothetical protein